MKQHHTIEIFSANCPLCKHITDDIQIGKCEGCFQTVYDVNNMSEDLKSKMKKYGVKAVPTTIIDGEIKSLASQTSLGYAEMNFIRNSNEITVCNSTSLTAISLKAFFALEVCPVFTDRHNWCCLDV